MPRKSKALEALERAAAGGSAIAAVQLDRREARKEREHRKPNATQVRAQVRDEKREAMAHSRDKSLKGDADYTPPGHAFRVLEVLAMTDDEQAQHPELVDRVERDANAWRAARDAEDTNTNTNTNGRPQHAV